LCKISLGQFLQKKILVRRLTNISRQSVITTAALVFVKSEGNTDSSQDNYGDNSDEDSDSESDEEDDERKEPDSDDEEAMAYFYEQKMGSDNGTTQLLNAGTISAGKLSGTISNLENRGQLQHSVGLNLRVLAYEPS